MNQSNSTQTSFDIKTANTQQIVANTVTDEFKKLIKKKGYKVPQGYQVSNALQAAVTALPQVQGIEKATPDSIKKTLFDMVVQGLTPAKTQCYFIVYGNQLTMQRSYFGTQQVLKRLPEIEDIVAYVVREGEEFSVDYDETGNLVVTTHHTSFDKLDNEIIGVYAVVTKLNGTKQYEVMTKKQIDKSWSKARTRNVQQDFGDQMAKRTVINRAAKNIINTSSEEDVLTEAINDTTENEYDRQDVTPEKPKAKALEQVTKDMPVNEPKVEKVQAEESVTEETNITSEPDIDEQALDNIHQPIISSDENSEIGENSTVPEIKQWLDDHNEAYRAGLRKDELLSLASIAKKRMQFDKAKNQGETSSSEAPDQFNAVPTTDVSEEEANAFFDAVTELTDWNPVPE